MPIYAYQCRKCGEQQEFIQKMSEPPRTRCETCGGRLDKLLTAASFHLKGGGWYADGYASSKGGAGGKAGTEGSAAASSSASSSDGAAGKGKGQGQGKESKGGEIKAEVAPTSKATPSAD